MPRSQDHDIQVSAPEDQASRGDTNAEVDDH